MCSARLRTPSEQRWTLAGMNANAPQGMHSLQGLRIPPGMYWSAAESARRCGVSRATIDRAIKAGKLAAEKDDEGAWRISPHALTEAGLNPGKPSPPDRVDTSADTAPVSSEVHRLTVELARVQADARVFAVERDSERQLREAAERERDLYRRMLEAPPETAASAPHAVSQSVPDPTPTPAPEPALRSNVGRFRRAWNVLRY